MKENETQPACEGHNWEIGQVRPEWKGDGTGTGGYTEIALVICTFCRGIIKHEA